MKLLFIELTEFIFTDTLKKKIKYKILRPKIVHYIYSLWSCMGKG